VLISPKVSNEGLLAERHAQLVKAATRLFLDKGFHKTSVREIAAAAGWQMGTLYLYISRKEEVLYLILQAIMDELATVTRTLRPRATARETFQAALEEYFRTAARMGEELRLLYREWDSLLPEHVADGRQRELVVVKFLAQIVEAGIAAGEFRTVDATLTAHNVIMLAHFWALKEHRLSQLMDFETYLTRQRDLFLTYLTCAHPTGADDHPAAHLPPAAPSLLPREDG
jgi:AcrR family transcriptional regulator